MLVVGDGIIVINGLLSGVDQLNFEPQVEDNENYDEVDSCVK